MPAQIAGLSGNVAEVEALTKAIRTTLRPVDYGALGVYRKAMVSGTMAAALGANSPIFSYRFGGASNLCLLRRVMLSAGSLVGFTAGLATFNMFAARPFTVNDTGGTAGTLTTNNAKLRTSMSASSGVADFRIAATAALTPGTRTKDTDPMGTIATSVTATAGQPIIPLTELFRVMPGEEPDVIAQNEGFVVEATVPATGTWQFGVVVEWDEILAANYAN